MIRISLPLFILWTTALFGQSNMRDVNQLINTHESAWPNIQEWADSAKNKVQILPVDTIKAKEALYNTQVTTRSPMGAVVYHSGGILVDNGWIRILGSGSEILSRSLPNWNKGKSFTEFGEQPLFYLIADDAIGGFFMLNGGGLGNDLGKVYYFAPEDLQFQALDITYTEFILFCFNNDLDLFYENFRWTNWEKDLATLKADNVFTFYPFLWSKEGKDINENVKSQVSAEEQYYLNIDFRHQLGLDQK